MNHHAHKHINIIVLLVGIAAAITLARWAPFQTYIQQLGSLSYIGAFLGGMLFVSSFTVSIGAVILATIAKDMNPVVLALTAGAGAVIGNFFIFRFIQDDILDEVNALFPKIKGNHFVRLLHTKHFRWSLPVIGALLIISPLPDEIGISLLDISGLSPAKFLVLTFFLNSTGMFLIAMIARS